MGLGRECVVAVLAVALGLSACSRPHPTPASGAPASAAAALDAPAAPPPPLPVEVSWVDTEGAKTISFKNVGSAPITVNQVIVNGLDSDPDCNIKVFAKYKPGETGTVNVPSCGRFTKILVVADAGSLLTQVSQIQSDISTQDFTAVDRTFRVQNNSSTEYMLNTVVFNNMDRDSNCNIKVFAKIEAHAYLDVSQPCGQFKTARLNFDNGSIEVSAPSDH